MRTDLFGLRLGVESNLWDLKRVSKIRSGVERLISDHPHYLIYVRRNLRYPHGDCFLSDTHSPSPECSTCFGLGYAVQFEKHKCRRVLSARGSVEELEAPGYLNKYDVIIYTPRYYYPSVGDLYIEVEWDTSVNNIEIYGRPTKVMGVYKVDAAIAMMEDEVSYFGVGVLPHSMDQVQAETWLLTVQRTWTDKVVV